MSDGGAQAVVGDALRSYALEVVRLTLIGEDWNSTFRIDTRAGDVYAARVYLPDRRSDAEVRTELAWLEALVASGEIRVPAPVRALDGSPFVRAGAGDASRRVAVFSWAPGEPLDGDAVPGLVSAFGEAVARLHEHGRSFVGLGGLRVWDRPFPHGGGAVFDETNADVIDRGARSVFERAFEASRSAIARLARSGEAPRIVHGDLHPDNVLVADDGLWFIDFDDCALAWPVQDLGVLMWEVGEDEMTWPYRDAFRRGYEAVASWPERWPGEIDTFAACRALLKADDTVRRRVEADVAAYVRRRVATIAALLDRAARA